LEIGKQRKVGGKVQAEGIQIGGTRFLGDFLANIGDKRIKSSPFWALKGLSHETEIKNMDKKLLVLGINRFLNFHNVGENMWVKKYIEEISTKFLCGPRRFLLVHRLNS
jgi:hypothetical protein